jgi:hypothetical protein
LATTDDEVDLSVAFGRLATTDYESEAIFPTDVTFGASRIQFYEEGEVEQTRRIGLDCLEEQRLTAVMRQARHDQQLRRYHDHNVRETSFNVGYLVL